MPIERIRILSVLVMSSAIASYLSGDLQIEFFLMLIGVGIPLWFDIDLERIRNFVFWRYYAGATLALISFLFYLRASLPTLVFMLVTFCIVYEYYGEGRKKAPLRLVGLLSFLILLYYARVESGLGLMSGMLIYLLSVIWCLLAFYTGRKRGFAFNAEMMAKSWTSLKLAAVVFPLGLGIFWLLPRFSSSHMSSLPTLGGDRISGFGDRVTLTDIGSLKLSRKHVMDLTPLDGKLHNRYLKGKMLDEYADGIWSTSIVSVGYPKKNANDEFVFTKDPGATFRYRIDLEALHGNTLFFLDNLHSLRGDLPSLKQIGDRSHLSVTLAYAVAMTYTFTSSDDPISAARRHRWVNFRQLPRNHEYLNEIANQIVTPEMTHEQKVREIFNYLQRNYEYTLEIHNSGADDPIREFLLNSKAGHCELFASAMILLVRSQGIPARMVTGFYVPEIHPSGDFYYITESDAHAWTEIYVDGQWQTIDPTPTANLSTPGFAEAQLASIRRFWQTKIMTWDYEAQVEVLEKVFAFFQSISFHAKSWLYVLGLIVFSLAYLRLRGFLFTKPEQKLQNLALKLERAMATRFGQPKPREPFYEYIENHVTDGPKAEALSFFQVYHRHRFSSSTDHQQDIKDLLIKGNSLLKNLSNPTGGSL